MASPEIWTVGGFAADFANTHKIMENRSFAFILGAGASVSSGIPSGGQLAHRWIEELHGLLCRDSTPVENWANAKTLDIPGFDMKRAAEFYPYIFHRRFRGDREQGYAYLEYAMERAEPSYGYSVLAQILSETRHRIVITTNFDNLVADAISIYGSTYPLIAGHESLTGFISGRLRRPLVAKIHRDLFLEPKNDPEGVSKLPVAWEDALTQLLKEHTPIFIGYGGNDGSLMGFLETLEPGDLVGRLRWCYREVDGLPPKRVLDLVTKHDGVLVSTGGFDELMLFVGNQLEFGLRDEYVREQGVKRAEMLAEQFNKLERELLSEESDSRSESVEDETRRAVEQTLSRTTPWSYMLRLRRANKPAERVEIARKALQEYPKDGRLLGAMAIHLARPGDTPEEEAMAEKLGSHALQLEDTPLRTRALILSQIFTDYDAAEEILKPQIENAYPDGVTMIKYAELLIAQGKAELALSYLQRAKDMLANSSETREDVIVSTAMLSAISVLMMGGSPTLHLTQLRAALEAGGRARLFTPKLINEAISKYLTTKDKVFANNLIRCAVGAINPHELKRYAHWSNLPPQSSDSS